jgi:amino acid transporter
MACDGLLPASLSRIAVSARTPAIAIGAVAAVGMTLALLSGYDRLINMSAFGVWSFSTLSALGLLLFRRRAPLPADAGLFRAPRGVTELFFAGSFALLISLIAAGSVEVLSALALMGVGVPRLWGDPYAPRPRFTRFEVVAGARLLHWKSQKTKDIRIR